ERRAAQSQSGPTVRFESSARDGVAHLNPIHIKPDGSAVESANQMTPAAHRNRTPRWRRNITVLSANSELHSASVVNVEKPAYSCCGEKISMHRRERAIPGSIGDRIRWVDPAFDSERCSRIDGGIPRDINRSRNITSLVGRVPKTHRVAYDSRYSI